MNELLKWLDGKKTYLCAIGIAAAYILHSRGIIDATVRDILLGAFGGGGLAALRAGVGKG